MRIVVTGATGNLGTSLVGRLAADDGVTEVVGLARRLPALEVPGVRFVAADLTADDLGPHLDGADVVVHLAWAFQPTHDPLETWRANVGGTERLLAAAEAAGVGAIVHASSVGAYSPGTDDRPVDESWPTDGLPVAAYGREKAYVERLLDTFEARHPGVRVARLRPAFVFKADAAAEQRRIFVGPLVPRTALGSVRLPLLPAVAGLRFQALHSADAAEAFALAALRPVRGPFNVAADPVVGPEELSSVIGGRPVPFPRWLLRAGVAAAWHLRLVPASPHLLDLFLDLPVMDTTRARTELGWSPRFSSLEALESLRTGWRRHAGAPTAPLHA